MKNDFDGTAWRPLQKQNHHKSSEAIKTDPTKMQNQTKMVTKKKAYNVTWKVMASHIHGGLPQRRERLYIIGLKLCGRESVRMVLPQQTTCRKDSIREFRGKFGERF